MGCCQSENDNINTFNTKQKSKQKFTTEFIDNITTEEDKFINPDMIEKLKSHIENIKPIDYTNHTIASYDDIIGRNMKYSKKNYIKEAIKNQKSNNLNLFETISDMNMNMNRKNTDNNVNCNRDVYFSPIHNIKLVKDSKQSSKSRILELPKDLKSNINSDNEEANDKYQCSTFKLSHYSYLFKDSPHKKNSKAQ